MCSNSCSKCLGASLIPLALCSIVANILLYFPNGETKYAEDDNLTLYVWFFTGIVGGGIFMLGSVLAALIGIAGSGYCFIVSVLALNKGPYCFTSRGWVYPFQEGNGRYLTEPDSWSVCLLPAHVVEWNVTLFSILLVLSGLEAIICVIQVINGLLGCLCGPCYSKENYSMDA